MKRSRRSPSVPSKGGARSSRRATKRLLFLGLTLTLSVAALAAGGPFRPAGFRSAAAAAGQGLGPVALQQIQALRAEKESRTPEQKKIDSRLLHALKLGRGELPAQFQSLASLVQTDEQNRTTVDITADVSDDLLRRLGEMGAEEVVSVPEYRSVRALVPLDRLEAIAGLDGVAFVQPKQEAYLNARPPAAGARPVGDFAAGFERRAASVRARLAAALLQVEEGGGAAANAGSVVSEGDRTHRADQARSAFHVNGTGVKIGVLSDGADGRETAIASGDLPPITILPGQAGSGAEGTAMLEIIHDLAPGAQLYFATAFNGVASFAKNIKDLRSAGCDIIVDDVGYFAETPLQDGQTPAVLSTSNGGLVTQAVIDVTTSGALYFSAAGNSGNMDDNTSGTWEGDFADGGTIGGISGRIHDFDPGAGVSQFNRISAPPSPAAPIDLFWSDPLGGSSNDYDLYVLNSAGTAIVGVSDNSQDGTQDPFEQVGSNVNVAGNLIIVAKFSGADRFLHLSTNRAVTQFSTSGAIRGHGIAALAYSVGATPAVGPYPNPFNSSNVSETFTSDGPRRIFFNSDGTPITPGNFLNGGGTNRQKPDITAADGVSVTGVSNFQSPFFGTSAAAPHAAAIAALLKQAVPGATQSQVRSAIVNSAIDIETPGIDRDTGAGIITAFGALQAVGATGTAALEVGTTVAAETSGNGNGFVEPGESAALSVQLVNVGVQTASGISATLSTTTPGIVITQPNSTYANLPPLGGAAGNNTPFAFTVDPSVPCNAVVNFTLTVTYTGGTSPTTLDFTLQLGESISLNSIVDTSLPPTGSLFTSTTGMQTGRVARTGVGSTCESAKVFPGVNAADATLPHGFDAYTLKNTSGSSICVTIDVRTPGASNVVQSVAYLDRFDPSNISTNYLGDSGTTPDPKPYSVIVPANSTFVVVVDEITTGGGATHSYSLNITGLPCGAPAATLAPTNSVPGPQTVNEDGSLTFSSGNGNQVSVTDPNGASHQLPVTLQVSSGKLTLSTTAGLTFSVGDGTNDQTMSFTGTPAAVNAALNGMVYTPEANFNGPGFALNIRSGIDSTDTDTVALTIAAVNDAPVNTVPGPQTVTENGTLTFSGSRRISVTDVDAASGNLQVTLTATNGVLSLSTTSGLSFSAGDGTADPTMTFAGTFPNINAALNNLTYTPTPGYSGPATLTITTDDQGNTGSGGALSDTKTVAITVSEGGAFQFSSATYAVGEAGGSATITVTRAGGSAGAASVQYATSDGTATAGSDYTSASGTLNFANGETSKTFTIPITNDALDEDDETVNLTLTNPGGSGALGSPASATLTITDDDATPSLSIGDATLTEGDSGTTNAAFSVTLSAASGRTVTVNASTADGTAHAPADYQTVNAALTFAPGETTKTVNVPVAGDTLDEADETFLVNLSGAANASVSDDQGVGTITDDDAAPSLSIGDVSLAEGNAGTTAFAFTVSLSAPSGQSVTVNYATANGTASGSDYAAASGSLSFAPGETSKNVNINVSGDGLDEPDETFFVNLSGAANASVSDAQAQGTILNDDTAPSLSVNDVTAAEGDAGTTAATFTVTLSAPSGRVVTVSYAAADGTAAAPADYASTSGTLTFNPGETTKPVTVPVKGDGLDEPDETFFVNLSGAANASVSDAQGVATIKDDDDPPSLSVGDVTVTEGDTGTTSASFAVTLSAASGKAVTVNYATSDGTANAGPDYAAASGSLSFAPGETMKTITVAVKGDTLDEANETFFVDLAGAANATISDGRGVGTINDDDGAPALSVNDVTVTEGTSGTTAATFNITLLPASGQTVTVNYATADGTATAPGDYTSASGTLTFAPGETAKQVTVLVNGDTTDEADETFFLNLSNPTNGATVADGQGQGTIHDATTTVQFGQPSYTVVEDSTVANVAVTRTGDTSGAASVRYTTVNGTASDRSDFEAAAGTLTFAPGQTGAVISVLINEDSLTEGAESFTLSLSDPQGAGVAVGGQATTTVTILDDASEPAANAIDDTQDFVRQHYHDFLNREPDPSGLAFWTGGIDSCGADAGCREVKRVDTSAAFFLSIEFQHTGYFVYRSFAAAFGPTRVGASVPLTLQEFLPDTQQLGRGVVIGQPGAEALLESNKQEYVLGFVQRPAFVAQYPSSLTPAQFVDALNANTGNSLAAAQRDALVGQLSANNTTQGRADVFRQVVENDAFQARELNRAFVLMEYFGYLRRNPNDSPDADFSGYNFWLSKLNSFGGDYRRAEMVKAFISSDEYRKRFGQ